MAALNAPCGQLSGRIIAFTFLAPPRMACRSDDDARPADCEYGSVTATIGICRSSEPFVSKASFDWAEPITKQTTDISAATGLALEAHPTVD